MLPVRIKETLDIVISDSDGTRDYETYSREKPFESIFRSVWHFQRF